MSLGRLFGWLPPGEDGTLGSLWRSSARVDNISGSSSGSSSGSASNGSSGGGSGGGGDGGEGPFASAWRLLRGAGSNAARSASSDPYAQAAVRRHELSQRRGKDLRFVVVDVALQVVAVGLAYALTQKLLKLWDHVQV